MDATMSYATPFTLVLATVLLADRRWQRRLEELAEANRLAVEQLAIRFLSSEVTPTTTFEFERRMEACTREFARQVAEMSYNAVEPEAPESAPHDVTFQKAGYRRVNKKTNNSYVATLFGTIRLRRFLFRPWDRDSGDPAIFPLELQLGIVQGATPALANAAAGYFAQAGASQQIVLERLRSQHGVSMGVARLRKLTSAIGQAMERYLREFQVLRILDWLEEAWKSSGNRKPALAVGRDGVTLREYRHSHFENATAGTVTVYDRAGVRLGTVYLAFPPELGQHQMTSRLTALLNDVLRGWEKPLPRLCYVTDAGIEESKYFRRVLQRMRHPRTGERLSWTRIVDFYHAAERLSRLGDALFGAQSSAAKAWAWRMRKLLKTRNGPYKVLHAAAALRGRQKLSKARAAMYRKAYNYIRRRTKFMQYYDYKRDHLPIGSGVTEAACKTLFAQRLKLSGMRWSKSGAEIVLTLRCALISKVWEAVFHKTLETRPQCQPHCQIATPPSYSEIPLTNAA
jgi:hypothetical protein